MPLRTLTDARVVLAGSSDYPVADNAVMPAVTRRTLAGATLLEDEALTVAEALAAYTIGAAQALGFDAETGSVLAGQTADSVILDCNPLETPPGEIASVGVTQTFVGGRPTLPSAEPSERGARPPVPQ